jgi:LexA-binding, inner membrane-associated putative hydrolase
MNVLTHALLPALLAAPLLPRTTPRELYVSGGIVALAGALPDLLTPHLSLAARYASWSHTVFAWAGFNVLLIGFSIALRRRVTPRVWLFASLAYALHLFGDALSGGIAWFYPVSKEIVGRSLILYRYWILIDVVLLAAAIIVFWWLPRKGKLKVKV